MRLSRVTRRFGSAVVAAGMGINRPIVARFHARRQIRENVAALRIISTKVVGAILQSQPPPSDSEINRAAGTGGPLN